MTTIPSTTEYGKSEVAYRTGRARRSMAASRGQRSHTSWVRRLAAATRPETRGLI